MLHFLENGLDRDVEDPSSVFFRTRHVVTYVGFLIAWLSKTKNIYILSTETENITLSHSMREILPAMTLIEDLR